MSVFGEERGASFGGADRHREDERAAGRRTACRLNLIGDNQTDYGCASTTHKVQALSVENGQLPAADGLDPHGAFVDISCHRESLSVRYAKDDLVPASS